MNRIKSDATAPAGAEKGGQDNALEPSFDEYGAKRFDVPILLSVPHAGRAYPDFILQHSRVDLTILQRLEDRYADLLVGKLLDQDYPALIARTPRAMIDLNRDERDIDPVIISDMPGHISLVRTAKQRGGLGLIPRFLPRSGDLWKGPIAWAQVSERIENHHRPYHHRIGARLDELHSVHPEVLLLDIHSMPPLPAKAGEKRPDVVIGDRFGASAATRLAETACAVIRAHGYAPALNTPYPGYHLIERHAKPVVGRHALQIEISRDLYLDSGLNQPGKGLGKILEMMSELVARLEQEIRSQIWSQAAE
ncbi:MAG: N-formylglutamate amidohydrolase [Sphingobium sp.]|jgi:N-formylglutamate amidohydrolase|nr:N-formylglutamate amidohydrolase [Sphingobium sp.]MCP5400668.1 N-formylglutamate amidohydrolase [Sphingomonas sp.]